MKISTVEEMRNLDKSAMEKYGISQELLMENAGHAVYFVILKEFGIKGKKFIIICGSGNNGGDGLMVARKIHSMGGKATVFLMADSAKFKGAAKKNYEIITQLPIEVNRIKSIKSLENEISRSDAIVDGIFGTGLTRNVTGLHKNVIQTINKANKTIFSIDIPSGINGNTGQIMGTGVKADYTVSFGLPKIGNLLYPGYDLCGRLYVTHISFPPQLYKKDSLKIEINIPLKLPERDKDAHKGNFGDVLFVAGASNYYGAPYFSALSFLKAGGGYSRLAAPFSISPFIANKGSEIVFVPQKETDTGSVALENREEILRLAEKLDMVVLGPGLSLNKETQELVLYLARRLKNPLLLDGDGITALSSDIEILRKRSAPTILTPHLGEMSRMVDKPVSEIINNKTDLVQKWAKKLNAVIVLKGAHTLIGSPDEHVFVNMSGNSGMASAGSGDVLTGTIAAMYGLGLPLIEAVKTGVFMHGYSGDMAAVKKGEDGITAQDILDYLPYALRDFRQRYDEILSDYYQSLSVI